MQSTPHQTFKALVIKLLNKFHKIYSMKTPLSSEEISLVLTCTIDVREISHMQRSDTAIRLLDYQQALEKWMNNPWVKNIILVENSGYPLDSLIKIARKNPRNKKVEFLSFDGQDFPRHLGKGYGEILALQYVQKNSQQLQITKRFLKINGRYYVPNIVSVLSCMNRETGVLCNLNRSMTFSDSRVFGGDLDFLKRVCHQGSNINDSLGNWFEHELSRAALHAIADGKNWRFITRLPIIEGLSGSLNAPYSEPAYMRYLKNILQSVKQLLLRW